MGFRSMLIVLGVLLVIGYFGVQLFSMADSNQEKQELIDQTTLAQCEDVKRTVCNTREGISEDDYPNSCFNNGEHVLDNPYTCS